MSKMSRNHGWTKGAWLAYKKWAQIMTDMMIHWHANNQAVEEMMDRRD